MIVPICLVLMKILSVALGARILAVMPATSYSHQVVFQPLWKELSLRGHQVTVMTTDPQRDPTLTNLTEIDWSKAYVHWKKMNIASFSNMTFLEMVMESVTLARDIMIDELEHPQVQELLHGQDKRFDVVIVEAIYQLMYAFSIRFDAPLIGVISLDAMENTYQSIGNPTHPVLYSDLMLPFTTNLSFLERFYAVAYSYWSKLLWELFLIREQNHLLKKIFGINHLNVWQLESRMSMLFTNTDPIFHPVRPRLPSVIEIGVGTHIKPPKPLPKNLQDELDSAKNGAIYFSLGSNVKSKELPDIQRQKFLEAFAELPYKVFWKFELDDLPNKPPNVVISKWFPQGDMLRHPNVKVFITQGGLQSTEEAIYAHVPMIGIPFFADQSKNVKSSVDRGISLTLNINDFKKEDLKSAILEIMVNKKYAERIRHLAKLAQDQPMTGLEKAVWWTEYVIRHKGADHFKSPLLSIPWYQYYMLDVIAFCLIVTFLIVYIAVKTVKCFSKMFIKSSIKKQTSTKKEQ